MEVIETLRLYGFGVFRPHWILRAGGRNRDLSGPATAFLGLVDTT
jgi:hypothetical protein